MKQLFAAALLGTGLCGIATAAPCAGGTFSDAIQTTSLFQAGTTPLGTQQVTCTAVAPSGHYITGITLTTLSDYTGGAAASQNIVQITLGSISQGAGSSGAFSAFSVLQPAPTSVGNGLGDIGNSAETIVSVATLVNSNTGLSSLTFSFLPTSLVLNGEVSASSINTLFDITTARVPVSGVPEPLSLSLVGIGLLGLAAAGRRRK